MTIAICLAWSGTREIALYCGLALSVIPAAGACVYLTYSRGGVIGSAIGVMTVLVLSRNRWTVLLHSLIAAGAVSIGILVIRQHDDIARATGGAGGATVGAVLVMGGAVCALGPLLTSMLGLDRLRLRRRIANWLVPAAITAALMLGLAIGHGEIAHQWREFKGSSTEVSVTVGSRCPSFTTAAGGRDASGARRLTRSARTRLTAPVPAPSSSGTCETARGEGSLEMPTPSTSTTSQSSACQGSSYSSASSVGFWSWHCACVPRSDPQATWRRASRWSRLSSSSPR